MKRSWLSIIVTLLISIAGFGQTAYRMSDAVLAAPRLLNYQGFLDAARNAMQAAGSVLPKTWNWFDTLGVMVADLIGEGKPAQKRRRGK